jgi:predicted SAM-dependent methyltransferase
MNHGVIGMSAFSYSFRRFHLLISERIRASVLTKSAMKTGKLHLGSGNNIMDGWTNVDIRPGNGGFMWDLRKPLPLQAGSISYIFTEHFIEHITRDDCLRLLAECRRVLKTEGVIRISTPDLRFLIDQYTVGCVDEWRDMGWLPSTSCKMMNEGMRSWGHTFVYDEDELKLVLREAGYHSVQSMNWRESSHGSLRELEVRPFHEDLIFEAIP